MLLARPRPALEGDLRGIGLGDRGVLERLLLVDEAPEGAVLVGAGDHHLVGPRPRRPLRVRVEPGVEADVDVLASEVLLALDRDDVPADDEGVEGARAELDGHVLDDVALAFHHRHAVDEDAHVVVVVERETQGRRDPVELERRAEEDVLLVPVGPDDRRGRALAPEPGGALFPVRVVETGRGPAVERPPPREPPGHRRAAPRVRDEHLALRRGRRRVRRQRVERGRESRVELRPPRVPLADGDHAGARRIRHWTMARVVLALEPAEVRRQLEVLALRDRVRLVVVTAGTPHGRAEERDAEGVDDVRALVRAGLTPIDRLVVPHPEAVNAGREQRVRASGGVLELLGQLVAGQLQGRELVVGQVLVEGPHDPVAVAPDVELGVVPLVAVRLGVADEVQPPASLRHSVLRILEQLVEQRRPGRVETVTRDRAEEALAERSARRQPRQLEAGAAQQGLGTGAAGALQPLRREARFDVSVEGVLRVAGRERRPDEGVVGPPRRDLPRPVHLERVSVGVGQPAFVSVGPRRARGDPALQRGPLVLGQYALGRHGQRRIAIGDDLEEATPRRFVRAHRGAAGAAGREGLRRGEGESALAVVAAVARKAATLDHLAGAGEGVSRARVRGLERGEGQDQTEEERAAHRGPS